MPTQPESIRRAFSLSRAAELLDISVSALRSRIAAGAIEAFDLGVGRNRILRIPAREIDRLLSSGTAKRGRDTRKAARELAAFSAQVGGR